MSKYLFPILLIVTLLSGCSNGSESRIIGRWEIELIWGANPDFDMNTPIDNKLSFSEDGKCCIPSASDYCPHGTYSIILEDNEEYITINSPGFVNGKFKLNFYDGYYARLENENWDIHIKLEGSDIFQPFEASDGYENYSLPEVDTDG